MSPTTIVPSDSGMRLFDLPPFPSKGERVYAISFDMDIDSLRLHYGDPYNNAYAEIRKILTRHGFQWQQGSVYFGGDAVNAVTCVLAAMELASALPWFAASVRDIRMLRIEEFNDLMPAVQKAAEQ
ncbi:virulence factor [bacterium]|nr:virulence factor [bacterium]